MTRADEVFGTRKVTQLEKANLIDLLDRDQLATLADTFGRARTHLRSTGHG